jgi:hypothetical protein
MKMAQYSYWVVQCKNSPEKCGWILLDCIGVVNTFQRPILGPCADFEVVCDGCEVASMYSHRDVNIRTVAKPCRDHVPIATFQDAIRKALHQD